MRQMEATKKALCMFLCLCMILQYVPTAVFAAELDEHTAHTQVHRIPETEAVVSDADLPDNDELFAMYVDQAFYGYEMATYGTRGRNKLTGDDLTVYDALVPYIKDIASGKRASTQFTLGQTVDNVLMENGDIVTLIPEIPLTFTSAAFDNSNLRNILNALMLDFPYEMYWHDKTSGAYYGYIPGDVILYLEISIIVANDYSAGSFMANTAKTGATVAAATNAKAVVAANQGKSDYEKLVAYKEYICNAVSYNDDAANENIYTPYGDPWQLIYVFDNNPNTNVVCEGYAKAFQYLCDLGGLDCISVSGQMNGGNHMWNVVTLDGANYLVDVTNSESDTIGLDGSLFMVGGTYKNGGYTFTCCGIPTVFTCEDLNLSTENYKESQTPATPEPAVLETLTITVDGTVYGKGDTAIITPNTKSIIYTVTGKNFANLSEDNYVIFTSGTDTPVLKNYGWDIDIETNTATCDYSDCLTEFYSSHRGFEVEFYNNDNYIETGVYVKYVKDVPNSDNKIVIDMADTCSNSWNGAKIEIYKNGTKLADATIAEEYVHLLTLDLDYDPDAKYEFKWIQGEYDEECEFTIYVDGESKLTIDSADCYEDGEIILTIAPEVCNHNYIAEVPGTKKTATCMATGSVTMKCSCGATEVQILPIDKTNHTGKNTVKNAKAATCGATGYTGDTYCECGTKVANGKIINATGRHTYNDNVDGTCNVCSVNRETVENRIVVHMYRMYNPNTGEHFYTGSDVEKSDLIAAGWQYEGVGFTFPANTGVPVHRLFQPSTGEHLYTMDVAEMERLIAEGWNYEGIAFNSAYDTEAVQHRLHNPNATVGAYHFTFSTEEMENLINAGWEYQGIGWYSCWK